MDLDDELCLCFHVTQRKIQNYLRRHSLRHASQLSECGGAGTGCGWCRPYLQRLFEAYQLSEGRRGATDRCAPELGTGAVEGICSATELLSDFPTRADYQAARSAWRDRTEREST